MKLIKPVLDIQGLEVTREIPILRSISWRVEAGQHWVILGPNGSGKTSLLGALTAYLTPSAGEIRVLGKRYGDHDWRELRKAIGLVSSGIRQMIRFEEPALHAIVSGKQAMINYWGNISESDRRLGRKLLREVECGGLEARPWGYLSQGEQQRVLIGRALMAKPRLLILDEPCAGLDMVARDYFLAFLQRLARRRGAPTLILVTHHVEEIVRVFTHVLLLREGRVLVSGPKREVLNSSNLSKAFAKRIFFNRRGKQYAATVTKDSKAIL